jgi:hypothetical protein
VNALTRSIMSMMISMKNRTTAREWLNVTLFALALVVLTTIPYLLASRTISNEPEWVFTGSLVGVEDGNSYLGKMRLGARGLWDFHLFYTAEPHDSAPLLFFPYILVGQIVGALGFDGEARTPALIVAFQVMRIAFDVLLIFTIYRFVAAFVKRRGTRFLALALATLGGGFGWLLSLIGMNTLLGSAPLEFYVPEGFSFLILFGLPHLALARAALLGGLLLTFSALERERWLPSSLLAGVCWLIVGLCVPFYLAVLYAALGAWFIAAWIRQRTFPMRLFTRLFVAVAVTLPLMAYLGWTFIRNPVFSQWTAQNQLPSPNPTHYVLAYGLLAALAVVGGVWVWRRSQTRYALLIGWPLIVPILVYLPINVQRRTAEAVIVPLALLAAVGVRALSRRRAWRLVRPIMLIVLVASSVFLLAGFALRALVSNQPAFQPVGQIDTLHWLNQNADVDAIVLSAPSTGNLIPAWTDLRTVVGHGPETLNFLSKEVEVEHFYRGEMSAEERTAFLTANRVRYVFYGEAERTFAEIENDASPTWAAGMVRIYDRDGYQVYEVKQL